jgi:hypothetical protein
MPPFATSPAAGAAILALMMAVVTACEQPAPTATQDTPSPHVDLAQAARTDGAFVFRGRVPGALLMVDFDRERTLVVGHTAAQLADICATGVAAEEVTEHDVLTPNGVLHLLVQAGPLPAIVWPVLSFDPCTELQGVAPLAEGTARAVYTDNDFLGSGKGAASFGLTAQGRLTETATGRPLHLNAKFRNVFLPDGTIKLPVVDIIVR